jgi:uncharacterized protein YidB (DUF937 family)
MRKKSAYKKAAAGMVLSLAIAAGVAAMTHDTARAANAGLYTTHPGKHDKQQGQAGAVHPLIADAAGIIGVKPEDLVKELKQGKSIADVAKTKGVNEDKLVAKLKEIRSAKLDAAVKEGKLSAEQAVRIKQGMTGRLTMMVNHKGGWDKPGKWHVKHHWMSREKMAEMLGISGEELDKQLKAGKSLAEIAESKGISREQLIAKIKDGMTPMINRMIDRKHMKEE